MVCCTGVCGSAERKQIKYKKERRSNFSCLTFDMLSKGKEIWRWGAEGRRYGQETRQCNTAHPKSSISISVPNVGLCYTTGSERITGKAQGRTSPRVPVPTHFEFGSKCWIVRTHWFCDIYEVGERTVVLRLCHTVARSIRTGSKCWFLRYALKTERQENGRRGLFRIYILLKRKNKR